MSHQDFSPPRSTEVITGVFLCRVSFAYDQLKVSDFESEQLFLPKNLERAVHKRQIEYLLGRLCIKQCFRGFGETPQIVAMGEDRSPVWPESWVGSISHSKGQVVAVLSKNTRFVGLGIDLEALIDNPSSALQTQICYDSDELLALQTALNLTDQEALTLVFSSKESLYKLIFPRYRRFFGFQAARVFYSDAIGLQVTLVQHLNDEFHEHRTWPVQWQRLDQQTLETFITEAAR
ncbi:MAG: 4'-phosphopantetheinyl transferase superfamily protein [Chitinophagaceae bacterium]|nr:4'-phosphopantetheinyl transferase superfamily protein [Oligoflexus sp.]